VALTIKNMPVFCFFHPPKNKNLKSRHATCFILRRDN
jgi:hypothetical protein